MKNAIVTGILALSLLAGAEAAAQGKGKPKKHKSQAARVDDRAHGGYHGGYGKNHGSYQGNGRKMGHYDKQRPARYRDRNVVQQQPKRSIWAILGVR